MGRKVSVCAAAIALALSPSAFADSFKINEYSASDLGRANTGRVTQTEDAAAAFGNPALMPLFETRQASGSVAGIFGDSTYVDRGSVDAVGQPLGGDTSGFLQDAAVPSAHVVYPWSDRLAFGLSLAAPFGLVTDYAPEWPGRYQALKSDLKTINIGPSVAYRFSDQLSAGIGLDIQYADAELTSAVDFGAVCFGQVGPVACTVAGLTPQAADGRAQVSGDDWSVGWNAGLAWAPDEAWMFGLHYRSGVDHQLEGDAVFEAPAIAAPVLASGAFQNTPASAAIDLPASTEIGARWSATSGLDLYANAVWTQWSSIESLRIVYENPAQPATEEELNYDDAWRYGVGLDYELNSAWTLRAGYASDPTPTRPQFRSARIPDNDRDVYALGATWSPRADIDVDIAYNRIEISDVAFDQTGPYGDRVIGGLSGGADVLSVGGRWAF